jgi:heme/copper-type cytochrome/quinol oxidase subunit 2
MTLHQLIFWIAAITSIVTCGLISYSLLNLQFRPTDDAKSSLQLSNNPLLEITWVVVPVVILIVLLGLTYQAI